MKDKQTYQCIGCNLYDELEAYAVKRTLLEVTFVDENGADERIEKFRIVDFETKNKEEFLLSDTGLRIRLDRLIEIKNA